MFCKILSLDIGAVRLAPVLPLIWFVVGFPKLTKQWRLHTVFVIWAQKTWLLDDNKQFFIYTPMFQTFPSIFQSNRVE